MTASAPELTAMTVTTATQQEHLEHLTDGAPVYLPYATVGHYRRDDPAASPIVATLLQPNSGKHPYSGKPTSVVERDGRPLIVATDRLAHARECDHCRPTWERYEAILDELVDEPGAMVSARMTLDHDGGEYGLLVDAEDLDDESSGEKEGATDA